MRIEWDALAAVCAVSLTVAILLVGVFSLGLVALTWSREARSTGTGTGRGARAAVPARAAAAFCFAVCAGLACYGIVLIVSRSR
ncbi:hypothetical protein [Streptomyces angustmyceticus]|uniref:hypothetical protein n=1 Tax=Streptomyces angustmyceticus TaxID=285578 RepID=UPI00382A2481